MAISMLDMKRALLNKLGFSQSKSHHFLYRLTDRDGKLVVKTKLSHRSKGDDIGKRIFSSIARQIHLTSPQLRDAVKCPLSRKDYSDILKDKNLIDSDLP